MISFKLRTSKVGMVTKKKTFVDIIKDGKVVATIEPEDEEIIIKGGMIKYLDRKSDNSSFIIFFCDF